MKRETAIDLSFMSPEQRKGLKQINREEPRKRTDMETDYERRKKQKEREEVRKKVEGLIEETTGERVRTMTNQDKGDLRRAEQSKYTRTPISPEDFKEESKPKQKAA